MVATYGGYYVPSFKVYSGVTQVEPLSPTIFNMEVDDII